MMRSTRIRAAAVVLLAAACCIGFYFVFFGRKDGGAPAAPAAFPLPSSGEKCAECHAEIHAAWKGSYHGMAWTDPDVRGLAQDFARNKDCWSCHAPEPVFLTGLGRSPAARSMRQLEGVGCIECHYTPDGCAGRKIAQGAWCMPVRRMDREAAIALCAGCHNQHKTMDEWKTSRYFLDKSAYRDCVDCHMPLEGGKRSHASPGGHNLALLKTAAAVRAKIEGGFLCVEVENTGCGHNFPTDARHRAVDLVADNPDVPDGAPIISARFRNPYRNETGENTQLKPGRTVMRRAALPPGLTRVRVRLLYSLRPGNTVVSDEIAVDKRVVLSEQILDCD